ncbi:MAG: methyltransferase domain-containing protein [archaeon]
MRAFEIIGSIAILQHDASKEELNEFAQDILNSQKNVKTVLAKKERIKGRLRTRKLVYICGEKTKETIHRENGCLIKLNVETCYFSPRMSNERQEVASFVKGKESVLVLFAGVSPFAVVIAKKNPSCFVCSIELGRECCKYGVENVRLNKLKNMQVLQGDVKRIVPKLAKMKMKFDRIIMARPQLKDTFLKEAFSVCKKGTIIHYHDFVGEKDIQEVFGKIEKEANKLKKKIKMIRVKKIGNIAPYRYRVRVDFKVV